MIRREYSWSGPPIALTILIIGWAGGLLADDTHESARRAEDAGAEKPPKPGVAYILTVPKEALRPGDPIPLTLKFENRSGGPVTIWSSGFWPNHRIVVKDAQGKEPPLTEPGKIGQAAFAPGGARDKNVPRVLSDGETYREVTDLDLTRVYRLGPGRYHVQVTYHDLQGPTPLRVRSDNVAFEIKK